MQSDAEFRLEIERLKVLYLSAARAAFDILGHRIQSSDESPAKKALTSAFSGATLN